MYVCSDPNIVKLFWILPLDVEKQESFKLAIARSRKVDDALEFMINFRKYPSLSFIDHLGSKLDRGAVWKDDLPKLVSVHCAE